MKNHSTNIDENCKIYFKEVLVNEINRIFNSDKFSHSYENLYLDVTFWDTGLLSGYIVAIISDKTS